MNILFFLTPKSEVAHVYDTDTLRQVLEKMENHRYAAVPVIRKKDGCYIGTLTEGDILWYIKEHGDLSLRKAEEVSMTAVRRNFDNEPVDVDVNMEDLMNKAMNQNFVPVIDDNKIFIGIVTRKDIIRFCYERYVEKQQMNVAEELRGDAG